MSPLASFAPRPVGCRCRSLLLSLRFWEALGLYSASSKLILPTGVNDSREASATESLSICIARFQPCK